MGFDLAKACSSLSEINCGLISIVTKRLSQQRGCLGTERICFIVGTTFIPWVSPLQLLNKFLGGLRFWPLFLLPVLDWDYGREVSDLFLLPGNKKGFLCKLKYVPSCSGQLRPLYVFGYRVGKFWIFFWFYLCLACFKVNFLCIFLITSDFSVVIYPCDSDIWKVEFCALPFYVHFLAFGKEDPQNNYWLTIHINVPCLQKTHPERPQNIALTFNLYLEIVHIGLENMQQREPGEFLWRPWA